MHLISKKDSLSFLAKIAKDTALYAPVKGKLVTYQRVTDPLQITLEKNAYFPLKQMFFKPKSVLFSYTKNHIEPGSEEIEEKVIFGVRRCDLAAIKHQDMVFMGQHQDPFYHAERDATILIGYHCPSPPTEYCFCGSLNLPDFYDVMFFDRGENYLVDAGSEKGKAFLSQYREYFKETTQTLSDNDKKIPNSDRLHKLDISPLYNNPDWKKGVNDCLSCGACTALCPTCYCFEIHDEPKLGKSLDGERVRRWSSCQLKEFTKVAGGHTFREDREQRFKHRIYHQLDYFKKKNGVNLCTGCGRCISGCPTRIDFVNIINNMK
jgi:sulfhydrogenase subunit beta (sulfur reductase)